MNTTLLWIWIKVLLILGLCIYYNLMILNKFVESYETKQPPDNITCDYDGVPKVDLSKLSKCRMIDGYQTYVYNASGANYEVSTSQKMYSKVCSGFCITGITNTGDCKTPALQSQLEACENLLTPKTGCISSSRPLFDGSTTNTPNYYYALAPVNSINSCS